jgi:hypothetical protein
MCDTFQTCSIKYGIRQNFLSVIIKGIQWHDRSDYMLTINLLKTRIFSNTWSSCNHFSVISNIFLTVKRAINIDEI